MESRKMTPVGLQEVSFLLMTFSATLHVRSCVWTGVTPLLQGRNRSSRGKAPTGSCPTSLGNIHLKAEHAKDLSAIYNCDFCFF